MRHKLTAGLSLKPASTAIVERSLANYNHGLRGGVVVADSALSIEVEQSQRAGLVKTVAKPPGFRRREESRGEV